MDVIGEHVVGKLYFYRLVITFNIEKLDGQRAQKWNDHIVAFPGLRIRQVTKYLKLSFGALNMNVSRFLILFYFLVVLPGQ
jgi:hypothetical protein